MSSKTATFNPRDHIQIFMRQQKVKDANGRETGQWETVRTEYLPSRWRLVWMYSEVGDIATVDVATEIATITDNGIAVKATITLTEQGTGALLRQATGFGYTKLSSFDRALEKAETAAVGRACAHLGYGTEWASDLDEGDEVGDMADSPQQEPNGRAKPATAKPDAPQGDAPTGRELLELFKTSKMNPPALEKWAVRMFGPTASDDEPWPKDPAGIISLLDPDEAIVLAEHLGKVQA